MPESFGAVTCKLEYDERGNVQPISKAGKARGVDETMAAESGMPPNEMSRRL
jgi:hypothetical protein